MAVEFGEVQMRFAELIWEKEPVGSGELVKLCADLFGWKKSTTYTVLKKLCDKGLFQNTDGVVTSRISKEDFYTQKSEEFVEEALDVWFALVPNRLLNRRSDYDHEQNESNQHGNDI